jgi:hypothetical protein
VLRLLTQEKPPENYNFFVFAHSSTINSTNIACISTLRSLLSLSSLRALDLIEQLFYNYQVINLNLYNLISEPPSMSINRCISAWHLNRQLICFDLFLRNNSPTPVFQIICSLDKGYRSFLAQHSDVKRQPPENFINNTWNTLQNSLGSFPAMRFLKLSSWILKRNDPATKRYPLDCLKFSAS